MTDNRTDPQPASANVSANTKNQGEKVQSPQTSAPDTAKASTTQTIAPSPASSERDTKKAVDTNKKRGAVEPQVKKVDIVIAGVTYPIFCPAHEEEELLSAVYHINESAMKLKKELPRLSQENLLVLCCLNLYERIHNQQKQDNERIEQNQQTEALLSKIMQDAQSIL